MELGRRGRKILIAFLGILAGLCVVWFSLPLWLPWVLSPIARARGAHYARYERQGYSRFVVHDLTYTKNGARFHADRFEAVVPSVWLWRLAVGRASTNDPFASAQGWTYEPGPPSGKPGSVYADATTLARTRHTLLKWLPVANASNGVVKLRQGPLRIASGTWRNGSLVAEFQLPQQPQKIVALIRTGNGPVYDLHLASEALHLQANTHLTTNSAGLELQGSGTLWSNSFSLQAQFASTGVLPVRAGFQAPEFRVPSAWIHLPEYQDLSGSLGAQWQGGAFGLDLEGHARPLLAATNMPPIRLDLHASGNTNSALIERAVIVSPWLRAELSRGLEVHFTGPILREPARLNLVADLGLQPWFALQGQLRGEADFNPTWGKFPAIHFHASGTDVGSPSLLARNFSLEATFERPFLRVARAEASFANGAAGTASATVDLDKRSVADGRFEFHGPMFDRLLPAGYSCGEVAISGHADGLFSDLQHEGKLQATNVTTPQLRPLELTAEWRGHGTASVRWARVLAAAGNSRLSAEGALQLQKTNLQIELSSLSLQTNSRPVLELRTPAHLLLAHAPDGPWQLQVPALELEGKGKRLSAQAELQWPRQGALSVQAADLSTALLADFVKPSLPPIDLHQLNAEVHWTNGPASFAVDLDAGALGPDLARWARRAAATSHPQPAGTNAVTPFSVALRLAGTPGGLVLSNLAVTTQSSAVIAAHGTLPLVVNPAASTNRVRLDADKPFEFTAASQPEAVFWDELATVTGLHLVEPQFNLRVSGKWDAPEGHAELRAHRLELPSSEPIRPALENLLFIVDADRGQARLTTGHLLVQSQPVDFTASLPLGAAFWERLRHKQAPDWAQATARLRVDDAELAAFEPLFPTILTPQGNLNVDLALAPGGKLTGDLEIQRARTRPLSTFGPIRDINLHMQLTGDRLNLRSATAKISSAPISATGQAELIGTNWFRQVPPFEVTLQGNNVPLARQPDAIVRGDLMLGITKSNTGPPTITGSVRLRDSYYLSDLAALVPGKVAAPERRPPYFSITDPALADWRLAVDVTGARFLQVRSPIFSGEVSCTLKLQGTLEDPIALGDVKIDSGLVRFPFGSLDVQQGLVNLTSQDPYHPQLAVTAASKQFGYDIRMQLTGPVDAPVIQFTSSPPLSSEQILLMVTAGEMPQGTFTLSSQQRAQTVALFLGRDVLSKLGLGDQAQQRLTIRSGEQITEQGRPTYNVEYKLTDRWSVTGEYDRFGDYNAGVKWRIFSR